MKYFTGEPVEVVLTPSQLEIDNAIKTARLLMAAKLDKWILDQLTIPQLENAIRQFQTELQFREALEPK